MTLHMIRVLVPFTVLKKSSFDSILRLNEKEVYT